MQEPVSETNKMHWSVRLLAWLLIGAGGIHAIIDITEFYKVAIQKDLSGYTWGPVNENPWYYSAPSTYAAYCLVSAVILLVAVSFAIYSLATKKERVTQYAIALFFMFQFMKIIGRLIVA